MPMDNEETSSASSKSNKVVYTMSNYDDTRNTNNKPLSHNPVDYIQKARVTRAVPPKPAYDPLQFVQLKPCSLVKTAQEQIKRVENVKKEKEEKKEEPEEWQCNLDNWKSSRRKRVEHIIDRVVEVKKLELEEHDRNRRKSKTFNQMMEQRGSRRLKYLPIYTDEDNNDLTELGLSSCDKNDKLNENNEIETNDHNNPHSPHMSQTNLTESNEYTDAIAGYKSRVSRASNINSSTKTEPNSTGNTIAESNSKDENVYSKEILHSNEIAPNVSKADFFKTKELFEKEQYGNNNGSEFKQKSSDFVNTASIKDRSSFLKLSRSRDFCNENGRNKLPVLDTSFSDLKNRLEVFEREIKNVGNEKQDHTNVFYDASTKYPSNSLNKTNTSPKFNKTIKKKQHLTQNSPLEYDIFTQKQSSEIHDNDQLDTDREDSGIHTTDVSCSVSQADEQNEDVEHRIEDYEANRKQQPSNNYNFEALPSRKPNDQDLADAENTNNDKILDDALEMAFQEIDAMDVTFSLAGFSIDLDKRSQNLTIIETNLEHSEMNMTFDKVEPYYQVPKSQEPYYEIPKNNSIPLYENVDIIRTATMKCNDIVDFTITGYKPQDPPKEKPPPPPIDIIIDDQVESNNNFKRINSTKSIENAIRNNRSSFLGFESHKSLKNNNQISSSQKLSFSQELDGLQKNSVDINYLSKTRSCSDIDVIADMDRLHHLRQNSDLRTFNCNGLKESVAASQTENQQPILLKQHFECYKYPANPLQPSITKEENRWLLDNEFLKQEDSQNMSTYDETQRNVDQEEERNPFTPPIPPVKPLRSQQYSLNNSEQSNHLPYINPNHEFKQFHKFGSKQNIYSNTINNIASSGTACIPLHEQTLFCKSLHALTTAVESSADGQIPKIPDERALQNGAFNTDDFGSDPFPLKKSKLLLQRSQTECSPFSSIHSTLTPRASNNHHWLVQEAEQRRINQQSSSGYPQNSSRKSLPDSVIQTITQRVQTLGIGTDRRWSTEHSNNTIGKLVSEQTNSSSAQSINYNEIEDKVLSVSGKKKCSHCNNELGRGAAMVIESLGLLYHLKCFKCFVCHTRLGDGFNGTDVRVRKYKLHCQNCFSSEDGVKFSCV